MGRHTTLEERKLVIFHYNQGKSQKKIAEILNKSSSTIQHIIERYKNENRIKNKVRTSSRKILNEKDERWIVKMVRKDPNLSAPKLCLEIEKYLEKKVSAETVRRVLRKVGLNGRIARKKPFISEKNRKLRLKFARQYRYKDMEFWKNVIFADESKFNIKSSDGITRTWREKNKALEPKHLKSTVKHGGGNVMVWGCMSSAGVGNLHSIKGNMNKTMYLEILKNNVKQSAEKLGIGRSFQFYQDNDPKHKANREWCLYNCPKVLNPPAQSPDLNVIEHLWAKLKLEIKKHDTSNAKKLTQALQIEWQKVEPRFTKKLVESMPNRLEEVIKQKGFPTRY